MKKLMIALFTSVAALGGSNVQAANGPALQRFGSYGWWQINYDPEYNNCSMRADFNNGMKIVVVFSPARDDGGHDVTLMLWSDHWYRTNEHSRFNGTIDFNHGAWGYQGVAKGGSFYDGSGFVHFDGIKWDVVKSFLNADSMQVSLNGQPYGSYSLQGSMGAGGVMTACQEQADYKYGRTSRSDINM